MGSASARSDPLTSVAGGLDVFGQGLAEAGQGGAYVFVTATGHAPIAQASVAVLRLSVKRRNLSAVAAVRERDRAVGSVMAQAERLGLHAALGKTTLERASPGMTQLAVNGIPALATGPSSAGVRPASTPRDYSADAEVEVSGSDAAKQAELLDALQAAGIDVDIPNGPITAGFSIPGLSGGANASLDPDSANRAMDEAVAEARGQAARLAGDAGRSLGPATQITLLARSATGREASVTVAVRFTLAPQR
jgi:uncharacterized protein YggE